MTQIEEINRETVEGWKWVVLDIDGVLIDPSDSYDRAVKQTGELLLSKMGIDEKIGLETVRSFRKKGRFGDDYKVTEGLILAQMSGDLEGFVSDFPRGEDLNWIRNRVGEKIGRGKVKKRFDRFYFGENNPENIAESDGFWRREKPLVDTDLLERIEENSCFGYITGRSREEIALAEEILDYQLRNVVTRDEYQKPDPRALTSLVDGDSGVYIGDTYNDKLLVDNFNKSGGDFSFVAIDENMETNDVLERILNWKM
ncbi:MAG: HAD family hydrolase [Candidatus Acetothermia bacterium]